MCLFLPVCLCVVREEGGGWGVGWRGGGRYTGNIRSVPFCFLFAILFPPPESREIGILYGRYMGSCVSCKARD